MFSRSWLLLISGALPIAAATAADLPLRDPTAPYRPPAAAAARVASARRYVLTGVLMSAQRRVAILDGLPCMEGDRVDGAEVIAIETKQVRLRVAGKEIVVHLKSQRRSKDETKGDSSR